MEIEEDLIEEIARIYGYDNIPSPAPKGRIAMMRQPESVRPAYRIRQMRADRGYQEAGNYFVPTLSVKLDANEQLSFAVLVDQPYGGDILYGEGSSLLGGTRVDVASHALLGLTRYRFDENFSVHAGLRVQNSSGMVRLKGLAYGAVSGYEVRLASNTASGLSTQDPRERPQERQQAADEKHKLFADEKSEFLSWVKLWQWFKSAVDHKKSNKSLVDTCHAHFLSYLRLREWREVHGQLHAMVTELGWKENEVPGTYDAIHMALLSGLLGNVGCKSDESGYYPAECFRIWSGCGSALPYSCSHDRHPGRSAGCRRDKSRRWQRRVAGAIE